MAVLDTSYLIALERGDKAAVALQRRLEGGAIRVPAIAWIEFLSVKVGTARQRAAAQLARGASLVPLDGAIVERAVDLQAALLESGRRLGWNDLQVAATALQLGEPLVALDGAFSEVPGLVVVRP
ncbi:MAG TPA: type II toxin-antitoxin system VapC family toxin [Candidatus Thermoplasmatota archaeon]|nr:type II toxin-antitoxin system VapC family toxin [Candidatus Thermoplasmatota archaeon]